MESTETIVNRVAQSGLITIDLEEFWSKDEIVPFDLKEHLVKGLVLMEKPFREALEKTDWQQYRHKTVAIFCSADALIPMWAYMLVSSKLSSVAKNVFFGNVKETGEKILLQNISNMPFENYKDKKVILKGCGKTPVPAEAYLVASNLLVPIVKSLMFGEACSTVPVYKQKD